MDRDSTGETPSALCPPQEAEFTLNQKIRVFPTNIKRDFLMRAHPIDKQVDPDPTKIIKPYAILS
jgi:hypothetical protein